MNSGTTGPLAALLQCPPAHPHASDKCRAEFLQWRYGQVAAMRQLAGKYEAF